MPKQQLSTNEFMMQAWERGLEYSDLIYHAEHTFDVALPTEAEYSAFCVKWDASMEASLSQANH